MRILIADDDDVSRLALEALLIRHGHEVIAVSDDTAGISALAVTICDLVREATP